MIIYLIRRSERPPPRRSGATIPEDDRTGCPSSVLSCTAWGFSCRSACAKRGELLPRLFTLACLRKEQLFFAKNRRCLFCDTLRHRNFSTAAPAHSTRHAAVWCSDFPPVNLATHQRSSAIDRILAHSGLNDSKSILRRSQPGPDVPRPRTVESATATSFCCRRGIRTLNHVSPDQSPGYRWSATFAPACRQGR